MQESTDLTTLSTTFPESCGYQVTRDNLISFIEDQFSTDQKVIVVQGAVGSGKTSLLAQFVKTYPDRCFSFFVGTTLPTSHPRVFLMDMCDQLGTVLGRPTDHLEGYDSEELKILYLDLHRQIGQLSKKTQTNYFFVIDGLEWISSSKSESSILELLPGEPKGNLRLLLSSEVGRNFNFKNHPMSLVFFSQKETEPFLEGLGLSQEDIKTIHKQCGGMPGYLAGLKRLLLSGAKFEDLSKPLPNELKELFLIEWNRIGNIEQEFEYLLALLAHSKETITLGVSRQILDFEKSKTKDYESLVHNTSFLRFDEKLKTVGFISDAYKQFVADRLSHLREVTESHLIKYYEADPYSKPSINLLPHYYVLHGSYDALRNLVTTDYISRALKVTHDSASLRKTIEIAADQALSKEDLPTLFCYSIVSSILTSLSKRPTAISEVGALLELGDFKKAYEVAYESLLFEDKLELTALISSRLQQANIPVPENIIADLEQMANSVDPTTTRKRAIEIAASLFDLLPEAAIRIVEQTGIAGKSEHSLDLARAMLFMSLENNSGGDLVTSRIADKGLRDFIRAHSPRVAKLSAEGIIAEASKIADTSGKVFSFISWCNEHQEDRSAWKVVEIALEAITGDQKYAPSLRTLRQLAQAVKPDPSQEVERIIKRIDLLKSTGIKTPLEEVVWLEMMLARLDREFNEEQGRDRMLEAYLNVESLMDLDTQCYALLRVLLVSPQIDPKDSIGVTREAEQALKDKFGTLLESASDHEAIAGRLLNVLAKNKHKLAVELAQKFNTLKRRDRALQQILSSHVESAGINVDLKFIEEILDSISNKPQRQYSRVKMVHQLSKTEIFKKIPSTRSFLQHSKEMDHPWNKSHGLAFAMNAMEKAGDKSFVNGQYRTMKKELDRVDSTWEQVKLGFELASILGKNLPKFAGELFEYSINKRSESPLSEEFFAEMYKECLGLAIKLLTSPILKTDSDMSRIDQIVSLIRQIPSFGSQCELLAKLALQLHLAGFSKQFSKLIEEELLPCLENCSNFSALQLTLGKIAPILYEYEPNEFLCRLKDFSVNSRDDILYRIIRYLLTKCHPDEPVDLDKLTAEIDIKTAKKVCDLIHEMSTDLAISSAIQLLVESIVVPDREDSKRERCAGLIERAAMEIADRLEGIAEKKLPDPMNIKHNGFLILAKAFVTRLKFAAKNRMSLPINWKTLIQEADAIPNFADRVFVYANLAKQMYVVDPAQANSALRKAEEAVQEIKSPLDRANRLYEIAETWKKIGKKDAVKDLLRNSILALETLPLTRQRDEVVEQVLELAHSVDPNFAGTLAPMAENPMAEHRARLGWGATTLQKSPQSIEEEIKQDPEDIQEMLGKAAFNLSSELNAGKGILPHRTIPLKWLRKMVNAKFEDTENVANWTLDFILRQNRSKEEIGGLFQVLVDTLKLCVEVGSDGLKSPAQSTSFSSVALPQDLRLFEAGSKKEALGAVHDWISTNTNKYLKLYDPYFTFAELDILKIVQTDISVFIVTSWKAQKGIGPGERGVEELFRNAWKQISASDPPWTQIVVVGIQSGDSPIHSRYILTEGMGLSLGTSLNSLGAKDTDLKFLNAEETDSIASKFVDPLLVPQLRTFKGEKLLVHTFVL